MTSTALAPHLILSDRAKEGILFLLVGGCAFLVDFGLYNVLTAVGIGVMTSKLTSIALSVAVAYAGNRYLAFAAKRSGSVGREAILFILANAVSGSAALACLGFSHYILGFESILADNLSGNVIGVALGTVIRYFLYRSVVFRNSATQEDTRN